jgi:flagellar biosynthetic protein FliO
MRRRSLISGPCGLCQGPFLRACALECVTGLAGGMWNCSRTLAVLVIAMAGAVSASAAPQTASPSPVQPAISLPHRDILDPDAAPAGHTGGAKMAEVPESNREIRRPAESAGRSADQKVSATRAASGTGEEGRPIGRQGAARGLWGASDFLPLAVVLALVALAAWVVKRYLPARRLVTGSGALEIMARLPLTPKQSLVLVKMGGRMVLVGVSPERVNTVCVVDDPEQVAELVGRIASQSRDSSARAFRQSLDHQVDTFDEGTEEELPLQAGGGVRGLLEKVRRLSKAGVS